MCLLNPTGLIEMLLNKHVSCGSDKNEDAVNKTVSVLLLSDKVEIM